MEEDIEFIENDKQENRIIKKEFYFVWLWFFMVATIFDVLFAIITYREVDCGFAMMACFPSYALEIFIFLIGILPITVILFLIEYFRKNKLSESKNESLDYDFVFKLKKIIYLAIGMLLLQIISNANLVISFFFSRLNYVWIIVSMILIYKISSNWRLYSSAKILRIVAISILILIIVLQFTVFYFRR